MGTISSTVGYAQDLNESLNNIRIVTGNNTEQMAKFAKEANKAAQALSTTTVEYTDAALIYYQQGLNDQEVQDRADITIKMAHASGQSAEIVSDQLTAIWNNFAKGGEDLEHFADVMTALGAATASSSDEIAGGLEKFASIAEMIGLSYEYAASALATITATTRQSEDVVGTALKTIFARIQGLKLGDTLDDGTDLNKYSEALQKVGISIFEQNGELKDMDNILDEMGAKWETLSKDQQVALAQTVAGVRQYNQLVSLMDNWDFM
jgi:TP901 family phage tail tape measure protein